MNWFRWIAAAILAIIAGAVLVFVLRPRQEEAVAGDPETRIIAYLKTNVRPGQPVLVTQLYNNVFTTPEERETLQRLYDTSIRIPAAAAEIYKSTGKIPTLDELSRRFEFKLPGEIDVLLHVLESDPRVPAFFTRDPATGEIKSIDVDRITADERFGRPLRSR